MSDATGKVLESIRDKATHDRLVREQAAEWQRKPDTVRVYARLDGWDPPPELNGYVPDVFIQARGSQVAIEVETKATATERALPQLEALQRWSAAEPGRMFHLKLAD